MTVDQVREAILSSDFLARLADPGHFQRSADSADVLGSIRASIAADQAEAQRAPASAGIAAPFASNSAADSGRLQSLQVETAPAAGDKAFNASSGNVIFVPLVYDPAPARDPTDGFCGGWVERRVLIENYSLLADSDPAGGFAAAVTSGSLSEAKFDDDLSAALGGLGAGQAVLFAPDAGDHAGKVFLVVDGNGVDGYQQGEDYVFGVTGAPPADLSGPTDFVI